MEKKVLTLSVKKEWFDKIMSNEKKEEYREIKGFWVKRIMECKQKMDAELSEEIASWLRQTGDMEKWKGLSFKPFTHVLFINGYGDDKPRVEKEIESIDIDRPRKGWCPDDFLGKEFFVIRFK